MTEELRTALLIKGMVATLPEPQQDRIKECVVKLQTTIRAYGEDGMMALAVVGAVEASRE